MRPIVVGSRWLHHVTLFAREVRRRAAPEPARAGRGACRGWAIACVLGLVAACGVAPNRAQGGLGPSGGGEPGGAAPAWATEPISAGSLDRVELWLDQNPRASAQWRNEALLKLAEGRLALSGESLNAGPTSATQASARLARATTEFQRVLADPEASSTQRRRAERGLASARSGAPSARPASMGTGGLVSRAQWGALPPRTTELTRHRGAYAWITVHHSALDGGDGSLAASIQAVKQIQRDHVTNRGYGDIGYHYLIDPAGRVFEGRSLDWQGAHSGSSTSGRNNNPKNVGICLLGDFEVTTPTPAALATLDRMVSEIRAHYKLPASAVKPHSYWKGTLCPGRNMGPWLRRQA
ncbi:MAG: peptidoglycan recognition family protein [Planctomycetota bacterium]